MARPNSKNTQTETQTRANLLGWARQYGCEADLQKKFAFWDEQIKHAKDPQDRNRIISFALVDIDNFFTGKKTFDNIAVNDKNVADELMKRKEEK